MSDLFIANTTSPIMDGNGVNPVRLKASIIRLGIDLGNGWVKCNGHRFASAAGLKTLPKVNGRMEGHHQVTINGENWEVGRGEKFIRNNRFKTDEYKVCLLTAIAMEAKRRGITSSDLLVEVCVGLPQDLHKQASVVEDLQSELLSWDKVNVQVDNDITTGINANYNIKIKKVLVFVEGALCLMTNDLSETLTMDIGAGTYNAVLWSGGSIVADDTQKMGAQVIFAAIANQIKQNYQTTVTPAEVERIVMSGQHALHLNNSQTATDLSKEFDRWIRLCVGKMYNKLFENSEFNIDTIQKVQFLGGGSTFTFPYWYELLGEKAVYINNAQYINSEIYEAVINNA